MTDPIKAKGHKLTNGDGYCYCKHPGNHTNLVSPTDKIKVRIQELCPDVMKGNCEEGEMHYCSTHRGYMSPALTLAVVLRAIIKSGRETKPDEMSITEHIVAVWNLEQDTYDQQSEECKQFIGGLLGVK